MSDEVYVPRYTDDPWNPDKHITTDKMFIGALWEIQETSPYVKLAERLVNESGWTLDDLDYVLENHPVARRLKMSTIEAIKRAFAKVKGWSDDNASPIQGK